MKKRILAVLLALATLSSLATLFAGAVPYAPPTPALKEFGQQHLYFYELEPGYTPREDGLVTESDGYGEPIATYSMRYTTTAEKVVMQEDGLTPRDEYRLVDSGDRSGEYNVFPTTSTPDEVWQSISGLETDSPYAFPYAWYYTPSTYSATASYYFYNPDSQTYSSARFVTEDNFDNYYAVNSTTVKYHLQDWALLTEKPADWETNYRNYFFSSGGTYSAVGTRYVLTSKYLTESGKASGLKNMDSAPEFVSGRFYRKNDSAYELLVEKPDDWDTKWTSYYQILSALSSSSAPAFEPGKYYSKDPNNSSDSKLYVWMEKPARWEFDWKNYYQVRTSVPTWKEGAYFAKEGDSYVITLTQPADWEISYASYYSKGEVIWYPVTGEKAPEWTADTYYSGTAFQDKTYVIRNPKMLTQKPKDWETNWKSYYYKPSSTGTTYYNLSSKTAPEFEPGVYYSGSKLKSKLFLSGEGSTGGVPAVSTLRTNHVILPEKVNLYARYDSKCLYVAIEVVEMAHKTARYDDSVRFCSTINSSQGVSFANHSFGCYYRKDLDGSAPKVVRDSSGTRTYFHSSVNLSDKGYQMILNKYGNPDATAITDVLKPGSWFNIKHYTKAQMDAILGVDQPAQDADQSGSDDDWMNESDSSSSESAEDRDSFKRSDIYGTTVYEYKQLWTVINDKYNGTGSAIPEVFGVWNEINLENKIGSGAFKFAIEVPRDTRHLNGSLSRKTSGNYPVETYAMRRANHTGLTKGAAFGDIRMQWANISSGNNPFTQDYILTDYDGISQKKTLSSSHILPLWFPSGRQLDDKYVVPKVSGAQVRTDGTEEQGLRFMIDIPKTDLEIKEAGVLIAPTEPTVKIQLTRDLDEIRYNNVEFATMYGFDLETRRFVNLTEDVDTNFAANAAPADSNSFVTADRAGGLPSAIYHVQDIPLDLYSPYNEGNKADTYTVEFTGLLDEDGTYNDWFTFYTIRPYIVYEDGTVVYGEHAYRSVYYVMCWTIQNLVTNYNTTMSLSGASNLYTMDEMARVAMTYADGTTVTEGGETIYTDAETTASTLSPYYGSVNFSLYEATGEARLEVFRTFAVSLFNRANKGASLRAKDYDTFTEEQKEIIDGYVERFENIWQCILKCESKVYYREK